MKRKLLLLTALVVSAFTGLRAQESMSNLTDLSSFEAPSGDFTIEINGTSGTEIKVPFDRYSYFTYKPEVNGVFRFVKSGASLAVYVKTTDTYESKGYISSFTDATYPEVGDEKVSESYNLLKDADFNNTNGGTLGTYMDRYALGSDWFYSPNNLFGTGGSFRVSSNNNAHEQSTPNTLVWRIDGNYADYYFGQTVVLNPNGKYKAYLKVAENNGSNGIYNFRLGSTQGGNDYSNKDITVKANVKKTGYEALLTTPSALGETSYFSVHNKTRSTSGTVNNACSQFDYIILAEANTAKGITGGTNVYYVETAIFPTLENGKDFTDLLTNAVVASTAGWTNGRINSGQQYTGAPDNTYMDTWNDKRDQKQTVNLPEGYYILKCATRAGTDVTGANIYVYANGANLASAPIHTEGNVGNLLGNGWGWTYVPFHVTGSMEVTIGFYANCNGGKWAGADNFNLTYYDSELNSAKALCDLKSSEAEAWKSNLTLNEGGSTLLDISEEELTTVEDYNNTITEITNNIAEARKIASVYANYKSMESAIDKILAIEVTKPAEKESRKAPLEEIKENAKAATTADAISSEISKIKPAVLEYVKKLTPSDPENNPFDLTFLITNPSFSENSMTGWEGTTPNFGNDATQKAAFACEYYQKEFDINQTLTDMVTGNYRLKVKAYQRPGASNSIVPAYVNAEDKEDGTFGTTSEIYVNGGNEGSQAIKNAASPMLTTKVGKGAESEVEVNETKYYIPNDMVSAVAYFEKGYYENTVEITATTPSIKFGFRSTANHVASDWTIFDDFRLYYIGQLDLSTFEESLSLKVQEANSVKANLTDKVPSEALTAFQNIIDENDNNDNAFDEEQQFTDAIAALTSAIDNIKSLEKPYASYNTLESEIQKLYDVENFEELVENAHTTLGNALTTAKTDVEKAVTAETINEITTTLKNAGVSYAENAEPSGDSEFDLTFMLTNPDVEYLWNGTWWIQPDGWFKDQTDGNFQVMQNDGVIAEDGIHKVFMEYYYLNDGKTFDNGKFNIYTKVTLPEGTYTMTCFAFAKEENYASGNPVAGVYFYANDTQGSCVDTPKLSEQSISFVNDTKKEVKIGLKPEQGNTYNWMGIGYVKLFKTAAKAFEISENENYDRTQAGAGDVKLTRTISATNINTLVLPFSLTQEELETAFGEGSKAYVVDSFDAEKENITLKEKAGITPNEPVLLQATQDGSSYEFAGRTIVAAASAYPTTTIAGIGFVGVYTCGEDVPQGSYIIKSNKFYCVDSRASKLKSTRAYFTLPSDVSGVKALTFTLNGGEATGILNIADDELQMTTGTIYDLSGRAVKNPSRGLYIINGKKVFVK